VIGFHAVLAALERQSELVELLLVAETPDGRQRRVLDIARQRRVRFRFAPRRELDELAGGVAHNGFAARLSSVPLTDASDLLELSTPVCLLGLDAIEDPHNLGAVIRVAAGLGLGGVVDFALAAKDAGFWVFGAVRDAPSIMAADLPDRLVLCLGAEAGGLRAKTRAALDGTVGIPLAKGVESLNLAVASGVLAWEWRRRFPFPASADDAEHSGVTA
jgi:23S rRNA (guanosine2251-2'-O)-methyltransferase